MWKYLLVRHLYRTSGGERGCIPYGWGTRVLHMLTVGIRSAPRQIRENFASGSRGGSGGDRLSCISRIMRYIFFRSLTMPAKLYHSSVFL